MLPENFDLMWLDLGMIELVTTLNRIPEIDSMTNCHGHWNYAPPVLPVKGGWFHFSYQPREHEGLVSTLKNYCSDRDDLSYDARHDWNGMGAFSAFANFDCFN